MASPSDVLQTQGTERDSSHSGQAAFLSLVRSGAGRKGVTRPEGETEQGGRG